MSLRRFSITFFVLCGFLAAGPASGADVHYQQWSADLEAVGVDPSEVVYPFAVDNEMIAWAEGHLEGFPSRRPVERLTMLQDALFGWKDEGFVYDETLTLTATEAFDRRRGNCMSFTALFIGLARGIGIPMSLVSVEKVPGVERVDRLVVVNRHVVAGFEDFGSLVLFDFNLTAEAPVARHEVVGDVMASAMYHANLGSSAIRSGDLETAEAHLLLATRLAPEWGPAWVNLGVVRYRQGQPDAALAAYHKALAVEPGNSSAYANIAVIHSSAGNDGAARVALQAATQSISTPFTLIAMADIEMAEGDFAAARSNLRRARWWYNHIPEVFEAMARLARAEGDVAREKRYLKKAARLREK